MEAFLQHRLLLIIFTRSLQSILDLRSENTVALSRLFASGSYFQTNLDWISPVVWTTSRVLFFFKISPLIFHAGAIFFTIECPGTRNGDWLWAGALSSLNLPNNERQRKRYDPTGTHDTLASINAMQECSTTTYHFLARPSLCSQRSAFLAFHSIQASTHLTTKKRTERQRGQKHCKTCQSRVKCGTQQSTRTNAQ